MLHSPQNGFGARGYIQLAVDVAEMGFNGADTEEEGLGDVFVG
jgi:hypothetical protein